MLGYGLGLGHQCDCLLGEERVVEELASNFRSVPRGLQQSVGWESIEKGPQ